MNSHGVIYFLLNYVDELEKFISLSKGKQTFKITDKRNLKSEDQFKLQKYRLKTNDVILEIEGCQILLFSCYMSHNDALPKSSIDLSSFIQN